MEVREPSAKYLARAAFKQTEVGLTPEDWEIKEIGDYLPFLTSGSRGWANFYSQHGSLFVRITNLTRERIYLDLEDVRFVNLPSSNSEGKRTQLQEGDVLVSITADIGIVGYITSAIPQPAYINQHIALVRLDPAKINSRYLAYYLASEQVQKLFRSLTDSGAKAGMNLATVRQIKFAVPGKLNEQQAIATALNDADALIESLEQLLAKKRQIKQGAMQELLTAQRRLPGFEGEWKQVLFGDVANIRNVKRTISPTDLGSKCVELDCLGQATGELLCVASPALGAVKYSFRRGDVLFGRLRAYLRKFWQASFDGVCSTEIWPLVPMDHRLESAYLAQLVATDRFIEAASISYGTHMPRSDWSVMRGYGFPLPDNKEQTAIAQVLSDMDAEIAAVETRLTKARAIKQGMMQELLTGRIRLV
ncbi:MAG: restriction endonuclease subunit S [Dechloromonas sp.]|nr:restriction endonuclease subunit S [Dechloromonas sp.]